MKRGATKATQKDQDDSGYIPPVHQSENGPCDSSSPPKAVTATTTNSHLQWAGFSPTKSKRLRKPTVPTKPAAGQNCHVGSEPNCLGTSSCSSRALEALPPCPIFLTAIPSALPSGAEWDAGLFVQQLSGSCRVFDAVHNWGHGGQLSSHGHFVAESNCWPLARSQCRLASR